VGFDGIATGVDLLYDYPLFHTLRRAFGEGQSIRQVAYLLANDRLYHDPTALVTFVDLHDVPRFMNDRGATHDGLKLAYTFMLSTRGTPLLYYGDEIGLPGAGDPDNRRDFPGGWAEDPRNAFEASGRTAEEQDIFDHLQRLLALRASRPGLRGPKTEMLLVSEQQMVYRRGETVVALNNDTTSVSLRLEIGGLDQTLFGGCAAPRADGGGTEVELPARTGCLFSVGRPARNDH